MHITALWLGAAAYQEADWRQVLGYFLLMLELPEIYVAKAARTTPLVWAVLSSITLMVTSPLWAMLLVWIDEQFRSQTFTSG